jgi:hypothetical protein
MYARVTRFEGGDADVIRANAQSARASTEPPEGVPATGFLMLIDPDAGKGLAVVLFETEEDMRTGDAALSQMSPAPGAGERTSVEFYEVGAEVRAG